MSVKDYLVNVATIFLMCAGAALLAALLSPLAPWLRADMNWPHVVAGCAIVALLLGLIAGWVQKRGWF